MINYSFIIPHRNVPDLLSRLLDTIPQREDIEIIVVDDNSDNDKKPIVNRSDIKLILLTKEESKGAGHARNVGLGLASGKWLLFADSDDYYVNGFMSYLDKYIESNVDIILFSAYIDYTPGAELVSNGRNFIENTFDVYYNSSHNQIDIKRLASSINAPWNKMFNHKYISNLQNRFEEIPVSNDAWFVKNAGVNCHTIEILDLRLYYYVHYPNSLTFRRRPLSHYFLAIDSNTRRNILLKNNGLRDMIEFPGFNKENILRDFGKVTYVRLFIYKLFTDPTYLRMILLKMKKKILHKD